MIDRLPQNVSQLVVLQWLSLVSVVRLDTALLNSTVRADWVELLSSCQFDEECVARNRNALSMLTWLASRKLKFASYLIEVTERNNVKRIAMLSTVVRDANKLAIVQVPDPVREITPESSNSSLSSRLKASFDYVFRPKRYEDNLAPSIEYVIASEDDGVESRLTTATLPRLSSLILSGGKILALQWLPAAPCLLALSINQGLLGNALIVRIVAAYPQLRSISLDLTRRVTNEGIRSIAAGCTKLVSVSLTDNASQVDFAPSLDCLFQNCPDLRYLAVDSVVLADDALVSIAVYGDRLQGLDLVYDYRVTQGGVSALAAACRALTSLGITDMRVQSEQDFAIFAQLLHHNAHTLQHVALRFGEASIMGPGHSAITPALAACAELKDVFVGFALEKNQAEIIRIVEQCSKLQRLALYTVFESTRSWCEPLDLLLRTQYPQIEVMWGKRARKRPIWEEEIEAAHHLA